MLRGWAAESGKKIGTAAAEGFRLLKMNRLEAGRRVRLGRSQQQGPQPAPDVPQLRQSPPRR